MRTIYLFWLMGMIGVFGGGFSVERTELGYGGRVVPLKIYLPKEGKDLPVILLSHGLGGSREVGAYLGEEWARRGYVVVAMQHAGSDSAVLKGVGLRKRVAAMKVAASAEQFLHRVKDVGAVLDGLEVWGEKKGHFLFGRMDLKRVGMAGHSFGAVTTQAVSGQLFGGKAVYTDPRIRAAFAMSPSLPKVGGKGVFGEVKVPWLLMTGTEDVSRIREEVTVENRRAVYDGLPKRTGYELLLDGAEHMAFSDRTLVGREQRNANHHRVIKAASGAFWDAFLKEDEAGKDFLRKGGVGKLLEKGDVWRF